MKAVFVSLFTILAASLASAQSSLLPYYITAPLPGVSYTAGETAKITWANGASEQVTIDVIGGTIATAMQPTGKTFTADGASGTAEWVVPADLVSNAIQYAFQIHYTANGVSESVFSASFYVNPGASVAASSSTPTAASAAAVASGSAVASAVASASVPVSHAASHSASGSASGSASHSAASGTIAIASRSAAAASSLAASHVASPDSAAGTLKLTAFAIAVPALVAVAFF
ncbi:hypothetical protein J3Q64DRAFT_1479264 [Phycomyces blakesleeanus]|uniref:Yeast cell wall synthesis Kre9/Knh1-like N-terminal domain-containing protein n=1 Tax=Phycomyces blakesleeanus TaxID=4837 RepID=A0ABR3B0Y3_PHYBL